MNMQQELPASTVSSVVANIVAEHVDEIFAVMGNGNAYFLDALAGREDVRITTLRHETATVASADSYYRISRKVAAASTTFGPGYTNAITSIAEAVCSRTPMVMIVGGPPTSGLRPWDVEQGVLAEAVGAISLTIEAERVTEITELAFARARAERLPVILSIPFDLAKTSVQVSKTRQPVPHTAVVPEASASELTKLVSLISQARRPLLLAGRGAALAAEPLGEVADQIGALTASSAPARGTFAGREWDLGVCGGFASEASSALIAQADLVLAVGVALNQFTTAFGSQFAETATLVQVDIHQRATTPRVDQFIQADAARFSTQLLERLVEVAPPTQRWEGAAEHARSSQLNFERPIGEGLAADGRLDPRSVMHALNRILPAERQVVSDGGHFIGWSSYYFELPQPDALTMVGTQFQSIGLGLPSAAGAARARPEATTIVVSGDGGGLMGISDLDSLVRVAKSAAVIIFNDACYGAEIHQYGSQGLDEQVMEIEPVNFAQIAQGMRATGVEVHSMEDLAQVQRWVGDGAHGTILIDLHISRSIIAPYIVEIIEKTLKK